jgi:hypothetical protein
MIDIFLGRIGYKEGAVGVNSIRVPSVDCFVAPVVYINNSICHHMSHTRNHGLTSHLPRANTRTHNHVESSFILFHLGLDKTKGTLRRDVNKTKKGFNKQLRCNATGHELYATPQSTPHLHTTGLIPMDTSRNQHSLLGIIPVTSLHREHWVVIHGQCQLAVLDHLKVRLEGLELGQHLLLVGSLDRLLLEPLLLLRRAPLHTLCHTHTHTHTYKVMAFMESVCVSWAEMLCLACD